MGLWGNRELSQIVWTDLSVRIWCMEQWEGTKGQTNKSMYIDSQKTRKLGARARKYIDIFPSFLNPERPPKALCGGSELRARAIAFIIFAVL